MKMKMKIKMIMKMKMMMEQGVNTEKNKKIKYLNDLLD